MTKVHRWLKRNSDYKENGRDNIEMAFMYSECGNEWTEVNRVFVFMYLYAYPVLRYNFVSFRNFVNIEMAFKYSESGNE